MVCVCDPNQDSNLKKAIEIGYDIAMTKSDISDVHAADADDRFDIFYYESNGELETFEVEVVSAGLVQTDNRASVLDFADMQPHTGFECGI